MKVKDKYRNPKALKAVRDASNTEARRITPAAAEPQVAQPPKGGSLPGSWAMSNREKLLAKDNEAERLLLGVLQRCGVVFNREHVVRCNGNVYYLDFVAEIDGIGLVGVEIDGRQHFTAKGQASDRRRERDILRSGEVVSIIRLSWATVKGMAPCDLKSTMQNVPPGGVLLMY